MNRLKILFLISLGILVPLGLQAQEVGQTITTILRGCVKTQADQPLQGINVYVTQKNQPYKILGSSRTDKDGLFSVSFSFAADSVSLYCSGMAINKQKENLANKSSFHTIYVEEKTQKLKEVVVKAQKIYDRGDTINYNVASFMSKNDQSIGDVLKRMPGISVSESGKIAYKGMPIKNFYIEGLDLMKGRYGVATNNVDPNSISTVQVLENYQDIKALKGLRTEERASINLKLKEGVKGVFNLIATVGGGFGDGTLWTGEMLATYFRRNSQLLATYKGNNTGTDLETELRSFDDNDYDRVTSLTSIQIPSTPAIDKRHYYFNRSHSLTFNYVHRIGKNGNLGINLGGLTDCDHRSSQSNVNHLLTDGTYNHVQEHIAAHINRKMMYGNLSYIDNSDKHYVKDLVSFDVNLQKGGSWISDEQCIMQSSRVKDYRLQNELHLTSKLQKEKGLDFSSRLNLERRPQNLWVDTNLFPDYLASEDMRQWVVGQNIESKNQLSALSSLVVGNLQVSPSLFLDVSHDKLESALADYENQLSFTKLNVGMGISAIYHIGSFRADVYLPVGYRRSRLVDKGTEQSLNSDKFSFEPTAKLSYHLTAKHSLDYRMSLSYEQPEIETLYRQFILNDYRQLSYYQTPTLSQGSLLTNTLSYNYKNIFRMLFLGVDMVWTRNKPQVLYGSKYDGVVELVESRDSHCTGLQKGIKMNISKGFDWKKSKIALMVDRSHTEAPILLQDEVCRYLADVANVKLDACAAFFSWFSVGHVSKWYRASTRLEEGDKMPTLSSVSNDTSVDFFLPGNLSLSTTLSHYYNSLNTRDRSFLLCEFMGRYTYKKWMFTLQCSNLFDKRYYSRSSTSKLTQSIIDYHIRPRSLMLKIRYRIF